MKRSSVLAREVTTLVHGAEETKKAEEAAAALFGPRVAGAVPPGAPTFDLGLWHRRALDRSRWRRRGFCKSKSEARREVENGGVYVNDERVQKIDHQLSVADVRDGIILLRRGKKSYLRLR